MVIVLPQGLNYYLCSMLLFKSYNMSGGHFLNSVIIFSLLNCIDS